MNFLSYFVLRFWFSLFISEFLEGSGGLAFHLIVLDAVSECLVVAFDSRI